ncbi:MAG: phenylalanine--tRNA ligase subunit beta, partial [Verrucomicrobiota bacterium]
ERILTALGIQKGSGDQWEIPTYRLDLERGIDLVEEVARVYGLDNVPSQTTARFVPASKADKAYDFARSLQDKLAALGFYETRNLKLISGEQLKDDFATTHRGMSPIRLKNPLNDEQDYLRPGILPGLLASAGRNVRFGNKDLSLFEMGRVFTATPKGGEVEHEHFALLMTGDRSPSSWADNSPASVDVHDLRAVLEQLMGARAGELVLKPVEDDRMICPASIELGQGKKAAKLGMIGIVPPARARDFDIDAPVAVAELNMKKLATALTGEVTYEELPKFPGSSRDIAMVVPNELPNEDIARYFATAEVPLLVGAELFDIFRDETGEKLDADKKSVAYSLTYRSPQRTLEAQEVEDAHAKVIDGLKKKLPVEFRS